MTLTLRDLDEPLLKELMARWHVRFVGRRPTWSDLALFRSLNMASSAAQMPALTNMTIYDVGRSLALWISAFEILAHPGRGQSNMNAVFRLLENVEWECKSSRSRRFVIVNRERRPQERGQIAHWIYKKMYVARNDFLHGNPVKRNGLLVQRSNRSLFEIAAPLYRIALTGFLPLHAPMVLPRDHPRFGESIDARLEFASYQRVAERALEAMRHPVPDD